MIIPDEHIKKAFNGTLVQEEQMVTKKRRNILKAVLLCSCIAMWAGVMYICTGERTNTLSVATIGIIISLIGEYTCIELINTIILEYR